MILLPLLAATTLAAPSQGSAGQPVFAIVQRDHDTIHLRLIGEADRDVTVRYTLTSGDGGNSATQSGSAALKAGQRATLLDLDQSANSAWHAALNVVVDDGTTYHQRIDAPS